MDTEEVKRRIAEGEDAYDLINQADPRLIRKFKKIDRTIVDYLKEVRTHFPDACYYTASGGFNLMLGPSHDEEQRGQPELVALSGRASIGDGDF